MSKKVVVLGGGVAGMSAAHELIERGFDVTVYEKKAIPGGKARSIWVPDSGTDGRGDLPGEHGFRFFPGFYRHLPDTMKRIPYGDNPNGCFDNIVPVSREMIADAGKVPIITLGRFPRSWDDLKVLLKLPNELKELGITMDDLEFFMGRMWQVVTSCRERRVEEYGRIGWFDFVEAKERSEAYQRFFAIGLTRMLVAAKADIADTMTDGDIMAQFMFQMSNPEDHYDRLLNGPTNTVWIDPWLAYLKERGVDYHENASVESIECEQGRITKVRVSAGGSTFDVTADYYVSALPVEIIGRLVTDSMIEADPVLAGLRVLKDQVQWMNGIQFFFEKDVPMVGGHQMYMASPWALTAVSQAQFWPDFDWAQHGNGDVHGVLSVDISNWDEPGLKDGPSKGKTAKECTREEIAMETWEQLKRGVNVGQVVLEDDNLHSWFLDPDIQDPDLNPHDTINLEPLLVNRVNSWHLRPDAYTKIPNLMLASDYVRTNTSLATMEAANEAARRAVNAILVASGSSEELCEVWPLHEPEILAPFRWYDRYRYEKGLPWSPTILKESTSWLGRVRGTIDNLLGEH